MNRYTLPICAFLIFISPLPAEEKSEEKKPASFAEKVKNCDLIDGLFNIYRNKDDGTVLMAIRKNQLDKEYIHYGYVLDGVKDLRTYRGRMLDEQIFTVEKQYNKIEFVRKNTAYYFDPANAIARAAKANISDAVLASVKILATSEDKTTYLIKADDIFLKEYFSLIKPASNDKRSDRLQFGDLSAERTRFSAVKNYPENTLLRVNYVYHNPRPKAWGEDDVTDARYITAQVQHALIAVPQNDYRPRLEDPRVGFFTTRKTDLTSKKSANYRDLINRWHLRKKTPQAKKSEPVQPITWWVENTTPIEFRQTIKKAAESWNLAFESAGFTRALVCKIQPDDATWDAGDIRYNVLRWTSSPDPPFGGYGPSFANPRTGQIIGADIMLEYIYVTNRVRLRNLLQAVKPITKTDRFPFNRPGYSRNWCEAAGFKQDDAIAARASMLAAGASKVETDQLIKEALFELVLHELGHTLGLSHNFQSSYLHSPEQLHDKNRTRKMGVISSVMDYSPANISRDRKKQGQYYSTVPGPYDHWAIRYGYTECTPENEAKVLAAILAESTKPEHAFGNDSDDMRSAGYGIDPRIMTNDLSSDPIAHAIDTIERVRETMDVLVERFPEEGDGYHELRSAVSSLMRSYENSATTLSRHVGGIYLDRSFHGQKGKQAQPLTPVSINEQKRALTAISDYIFHPGAFNFINPELISHLQLKRRGFSHSDLDANEDPKIHSSVHAIQDEVLDHLLHKNTLQRIIDTGLYGNKMSLAEMMGELHIAIMNGDLDSFREAAQIDYVKRLIKISGLTDQSDFPPQAQSQAVYLLEKLKRNLKQADTAHTVHLNRLVRNALAGK